MNENEHSFQDQFRNTPEGQKYLYITRLILWILIIGMLLVVLLFRGEDVGEGLSWLIGSLRAIFLGLSFGYLLNPLDNSIRKFFRHHYRKTGKLSGAKAESHARIWGVTLASLFGIGVVFALLMLIIPSFVDSVYNLSSIIPGNLEKITDWINSHAGSESAFSQVINSTVDAAQNWIKHDLKGYAASLAPAIVSTGMQVVSYVADFLIAFIVAIYALLEKEAFARRSKRMLFSCFKTEKANRILDICRHGNKIFGSFLSGKLLDSLIVGVLCFLLMTVLQIPYAILVSVVIGCTNIIPFMGPFIGGIPCAAIILLASPQKGIIFIIMFLILMQVDGNVIGPMILGDRTGVSAFWIICSLLFFKAVFGLLGTGMSIFGMIIGVPLFCVIDYVIGQNNSERLKRRNLDETGIDFKDVESYDTENQTFVTLPKADDYVPLSQRINRKSSKLRTYFETRKQKKGKKK